MTEQTPTERLVELFTYVSITEEGYAIVKDAGSDVIPVALVSLDWDDKSQILFGVRNLSINELEALVAYGKSIDPEEAEKNYPAAPEQPSQRHPFIDKDDFYNCTPSSGLFPDIRNPHDQ